MMAVIRVSIFESVCQMLISNFSQKEKEAYRPRGALC